MIPPAVIEDAGPSRTSLPFPARTARARGPPHVCHEEACRPLPNTPFSFSRLQLLG